MAGKTTVRDGTVGWGVIGCGDVVARKALLEICCATAIVDRVDRLLGSQGTSLFKSRFWVKEPRSDVEVPWRQDVGPRNGGFRPDGSPVESITAWLAIDPAGPGNGGLQIIPKSHRLPLGDLNQNIEVRLDELRERGELDLASAVTLELKPGQVYLFHSWLLHASGRNEADSRRAALNIRFVAPHDERESDAFYLPVR